MDHLGTNPTALLDTHLAPEPSAGSIHQSSQAPPPPPALAEESLDRFHDWKNIDEQGFYDEEGFLYPSCNLTCEKLKDRKEDDVVIFNYSLNRADGDPPAEGNGPSSGSSGEIGDTFFQVSKDKLIDSEQFNQMINPTKEPRQIQSRARLGIVREASFGAESVLYMLMFEGVSPRDFPQCYDTYDDNLLNSMAKELHLPNPATFGHAHSKRVLTLPGRGMFRTGFSLRVPSKDPSELAKPGSLEDRITLFVSFPYFGKSSGSIPLGPEGESVELLDFKCLVVDVPDCSAVVSGGDKDDLGEILVHQARYMIFDNCTMATFRSREDSAKDQVPLHCSQERIGAFGAMIQMIANRMDSESWTLGKLQTSLCKLEEDVVHMISDAETYEDDEGMKRKQKRVQNLLASFNRLSASLFAATSVVERQITVLQDLHSLFLTSCRTKIKDYQKGYTLRQNPFYKNITPIPILSENSEQIWPNTLDTIDEVVRERKCFVKKVRGLVENMDIRREILSAFLKSDRATSERTVQEATEAIKRIEDTLKKTQAQVALQGRVADSFTLITVAFLPLNFCASYFGMQTVEEFGGSTPTLSLKYFWKATSPIVLGMLCVAATIIIQERPFMVKFRASLSKKLSLFPKEKTGDLKEQRPMMAKSKPHVKKRLPWSLGKRISDPETPSPQGQAPTRPNPHEQALAGLPQPHIGGENEK